MARINVDNEFLCDPRITIMATKMPRHEAYGALVALWEVGQSYWKKNRGLIPLEIFDFLPRANELAQCGFVDKRPDGVYCKGAEERWGFLLSASEAGKKSAAARMEKYGTAIPSHAKNSPSYRTATEGSPERRPNGLLRHGAITGKRGENGSEEPDSYRTATEGSPERRPNGTEHSSSSLGSSPPKVLALKQTKKSLVQSGEGANPPVPSGPPTENSGVNIFLKAYIDAWQLKYETKKRPDINGKVVGQAKLFLKTRQLEEACQLVQAFCQMPDKWFETKYHDLITFFANIPKVVVALDRGRADPKKRSWEDIIDEQEGGKNGALTVQQPD